MQCTTSLFFTATLHRDYSFNQFSTQKCIRMTFTLTLHASCKVLPLPMVEMQKRLLDCLKEKELK